MTTLTRSEVRDNRQKWIDFLMVDGRKKAMGVLDSGNGERCCLGHACYILGEKRESHSDGSFTYYNGEEYTATPMIVMKLGLWTDSGDSDSGAQLKVFKTNKFNRTNLAAINDDTSAGPGRIGKYLQTVIEGGVDTPFRPLSEYPETI